MKTPRFHCRICNQPSAKEVHDGCARRADRFEKPPQPPEPVAVTEKQEHKDAVSLP